MFRIALKIHCDMDKTKSLKSAKTGPDLVCFFVKFSVKHKKCSKIEGAYVSAFEESPATVKLSGLPDVWILNIGHFSQKQSAKYCINGIKVT